jgi:membrane protein DedA with SNARE-associated domain
MFEDIGAWFAATLLGIKAWILGFIASYGALGVFVGMFFESSVLPIPSELVLVTAGMSGIPLWEITIFGALGSTAGAIIGYYIGRGGRPLINKYGKYLLLTEKRLLHAEQWANRRGRWAVLISRLIPFLPFKVFSIIFGVMKTDVKEFVIFTFIGALPRCFLLALLGSYLVGLELLALVVLLLCFVCLLVVWKFGLHEKLIAHLRK